MYRILQLTENLFEFHSFDSPKPYKGDQLMILTYAVFILGFDPEELQFAFLDMIDKENDTAEFGINKMFLFSYQRKERVA